MPLSLRPPPSFRHLGWEPKISLEEGLPKAVAYFRSLDLSRFRKPTKHTAHMNTDDDKNKRQKKE
jgi:UDP-glucuronate decarboxylase